MKKSIKLKKLIENKEKLNEGIISAIIAKVTSALTKGAQKQIYAQFTHNPKLLAATKKYHKSVKDYENFIKQPEIIAIFKKINKEIPLS